MKEIKKFHLRLVKEEGTSYNLDKEIVKRPANAAKLFENALDMDIRTQEVFAIICLDIKNQATGVMEVSVGGLSSAQVHPRDVFQRAILQNAAAIICGHNHPSGIPDPSRDDINITKRLSDAGKIVGIDVLDHIIIGENCWYSMKEHGDF